MNVEKAKAEIEELTAKKDDLKRVINKTCGDLTLLKAKNNKLAQKIDNIEKEALLLELEGVKVVY